MQVWRSAHWPSGSGSGCDHCSGTWSPESVFSLASPLGSLACRGHQRPTMLFLLSSVLCLLIVDWWWQREASYPSSHPPKEGVMLHANLPQSLGCSVVQQLETDGGFKLVKLGTGRVIVVSLELITGPEGGSQHRACLNPPRLIPSGVSPLLDGS